MSRSRDRRSASDEACNTPRYGGRFVEVYFDDDFGLPNREQYRLANGPTTIVEDALAALEGGFMSRMWAAERAASAALNMALQANDEAGRRLASCRATSPMWEPIDWDRVGKDHADAFSFALLARADRFMKASASFRGGLRLDAEA